MSADRLPDLKGNYAPVPSSLSRAGRDLARRLKELRSETTAAQAEARAQAAASAAWVEEASFVAQTALRHVGMATDTEEHLLRRHPYPAQAVRLGRIVDALADLAADEVALMALRARRTSGR